jgi:two-component system, cell cycle sensor histidine kinase and response regulator CckA
VNENSATVATTTDRNERFYRTLVDQALDIITVCDLSGTIRFKSRAVERVLGYTPDELVGRNLFDLLHPDDVARVREKFDEAAASGRPSPPVEYRYRHKDGGWRMLEGVGQPCAELGESGLGIIHSRDVTDRVRLEAQYRHAQKLEVIGRMTGAVAHDFNNLLTAILCHATTVLESDDADGARGNLLHILAAAERAAGLTQQLLRFARRDDKRRTKVTDVHTVIGEMTGLLNPLLGKSTTLTLSPVATRTVVALDQGLLVQVVMNLAVNAFDAMPDGGRLTIATRNAPRRTSAGGDVDHLVLEVTDTGIGMPPDICARAFEPFFTTKDPGKGTGLGLSTVVDIIGQAKGEVELTSAAGVGTSFEIWLPLARIETVTTQM